MDLKTIWRKDIIAFDKQSILLIIIPYLGFNWQELVQSPFFSLSKLFSLIAILIIAELLFKLILLFKSKYTIYISVIIS